MTKRCPRQQTALTPCVVVDGPICYTLGAYRRPLCVGCDAGPTTTGVGVNVAALTREFDAYHHTGRSTRQFPIPTIEQIARAKERVLRRG
jgi:hypothetical protein